MDILTHSDVLFLCLFNRLGGDEIDGKEEGGPAYDCCVNRRW